MESRKEDYPVALLLGIQENIEGRLKSLYLADDHFLEHEKEGF